MVKFVTTIAATLAVSSTVVSAADNSTTAYIPAVVDFQNHTSFNGTECGAIAEACFNGETPIIEQMADGENTMCPMLGESFEFIAKVLECMVDTPNCDTTDSFVDLIEEISSTVDGVTCLKNGTIYAGCEEECRTAVEEFDELSSLFGDSNATAVPYPPMNETTSAPTNGSTVVTPPLNETTSPPLNETTSPPLNETTSPPLNETTSPPTTNGSVDYNITAAPTEYNTTEEPTVSLEELCFEMSVDCINATSTAAIEKMNINDNTCDEYLSQFDMFAPLFGCLLNPTMAEAGCLETSYVMNGVNHTKIALLASCEFGFNDTVVETDAPTVETVPPTEETLPPTNSTEAPTVIIPGGNGTESNSTALNLFALVVNGTMNNETSTDNGTTTDAPVTDGPVCADGCEEKILALIEAAKQGDVETPEPTTGGSTEAPTDEPSTGAASADRLFNSVAVCAVAAIVALML